MIINAILNFIFSAISGVLSLIPTVQVPAELLGAVSEIASWCVVINYYIPFDTFLACLSIYFTFWLAFAALSAVLQLL